MSDFPTARLLDSAIATLERAILPELSRDESRIALDLVIRVLGMLSARSSTREEALEQLLLQLQALLGMPDNVNATAIEATARLQRLEAMRQLLEANVSQHIPEWIAQAGSDGSHREDAVRSLRAVIDSERDFLARQDPDILGGSAVVYRAGRIDRSMRIAAASKKTIDAASLTQYLRRRFPERNEIVARDVRLIGGGFSKTTVLFEIAEPSRGSERVAMRKDLPVPMMGNIVSHEYPLLEKLHRAGVRVAPPRWLESDSTLFDGEFFISSAVAGSTQVAQWTAEPAAAAAVTRDLAQIMARYHSMDLAALGYDADVAQQSAGDAMLAEIASWENLYQRRRRRNYPLMEIPLAWLKANVPKHLFGVPASIVHGDVGFHNLMVDEGRVTALLDWEFWHFGDPAEDLAYLRPFMQQLGAWEDFLRHYREAGGAAYSEQAERFYRVWSLTRNPIGTLDAQWIFEHHLPDELKLAVAAYIFSPYLELDSCKLVMEMIDGQ